MVDSETENIKAIIGNLLRKVDNNPSVKSVISAFDPFASKSSNCKALNSPKFSVENLEECAVFLGIKVADKDNYKLFTKSSLSTRLILSLMALLPAKCGECSQEYVINHEPDVEPFFRCYKCFQGAHCCEINRKLHEAIAPLNTPGGFVWLCQTCHEQVNPVEPRKQRSRHHSESQNTTSEKSKSQSSVTFNETGLQSSTGVACSEFLQWKCSHGIRGNKLIDGKRCSFNHPRVCFKFRRSGNKGCALGDRCDFFHPPICPCKNSTCKSFHPTDSRAKKKDKKKKPDPQKRDTGSSQRKPKGSDFLELRDLVLGLGTKFKEMDTKFETLKAELETAKRPEALLQNPTPQSYRGSHPFHLQPAQNQSLGYRGPLLPHHPFPYTPQSWY
ncbi:hypothetical protein ACHWQZ_G015733 [Mnemiopsis leidyi]